MKYCDLHNHTCFSDGSDTPYELCKKAKEKGLLAIAITDHNTVKGIFEFKKHAEEFNLGYLLGSEITSEHYGKEVHVLCMGINENNASCVAEFVDNMQKIKRKGNLDLAEKLRKMGYEIHLEALERRFGENINRAHFAKELVERGAIKSTSEAFEGILKEGNGIYVPAKRPSTLSVIKAIKSWGCVPVFAHPILSFDEKELEIALPLMKNAGLVGMEAYYSKFTKEQTEYLTSLCQKYELALSGGSDYHGTNKTDADLGSACVPYTCFEKLKSLIG